MEEIKRVLFTRRRILVLLLLLGYCIFFFCKPMLSGNAFDFRDGWAPYLENYRDEEDLAKINRQLNRITNNGEDYQALDMYGHMFQNQLQYLMDYPKFLDGVQQQAGTILGVSIFMTDDDSVIKTAEDYARMEGVKLSIGMDFAVTQAFWTNVPSDWLLTAYILVIAFSFMSERKRGLWNLVCASAGGRTKLPIYRLVVLLLASLIGAASVTAIEAVTGWIRYGGFDELDRIVQSIDMFQNFTIPMTIGQFWLFYGFLRFIGVFVVGMVFWLFFELIPDKRLAAIAFVLFAGLEYVLFTILPGNFVLDALNLFMFISPKNLVTSYEVLTPFDLTIGRLEAYFVAAAVISAVSAVVILLVSRVRRPSGGVAWLIRLTDFWRRHTARIGFHGNLFFHELYKMLVTGRGAIVILAALLICYNIAESPYLNEDSYMNQSLETYYRQSQGEVGQRSDEYVQKQRDKIAQRKADYAEAQEKYEKGSISDTEFYAIELQFRNLPEQEQALDQFQVDLELLKTMDNGYIVPHWVYAELFGIQDNTGTTLQAVCFIAIALLCVLYASTEASTGMTKARRATVKGRNKALLARYGAGAAFSALVCAMIWALQILLLKSSYGSLPWLEAPVSCLHYFRDVSENISIIGYWALQSALRTGMMCVWSVALLWATDRVQK